MPSSAPQFTIWQGPSGPPQCLRLSPPGRIGLGGPESPRSPLSYSPLSAVVPSGPLSSSAPGRASPAVRHSTAPPPCPGRASPRLLPVAGPPSHWLARQRRCHASGCRWLSIKAALRHLRTKMEQHKNRTQGGSAKRVNRVERTIRGDARGEIGTVW